MQYTVVVTYFPENLLLKIFLPKAIEIRFILLESSELREHMLIIVLRKPKIKSMGSVNSKLHSHCHKD